MEGRVIQGMGGDSREGIWCDMYLIWIWICLC